MKKIQKSKKGFTLVEMVLVLGIGAYLNKAKAAASSVVEHNSSVQVVNSEIDAVLG